MKTRVDQRFQDEARAASLRFRCDDCAHFDPARSLVPGDSEKGCAHGYPTGPHRPVDLAVGAVVVFCKEFELGAGEPP